MNLNNVFVISWPGQHDNAASIAKEILPLTDKLSVIYSDPNPDFTPDIPCNLIRRPNDLYWEDKFKACLDATDKGPILVIQGDCRCENWEKLLKACVHANTSYKNIGVWAPHIIGTPYDLSVSKIFKIANSSLYVSALTDGIIFSLSEEILERMRNVKYGDNLFGWGIGALFCAAAHVMDKLVVIDESVDVFHPKGRGYNAASAKVQREKFLSQYTQRERIELELLQSHVRLNEIKKSSN